MFKFRIRPGYGSKELLIEFMTDAEEPGFSDALFDVIGESGFSIQISHSAIALWDFDKAYFELKGDHGILTLTLDDYGCVFITGKRHQEGIKYLAKYFGDSEVFERQEVDYSEFT